MTVEAIRHHSYYPTVEENLATIQEYLWDGNINASLECEEDVTSLEWWGHDGSLCAIIVSEEGEVSLYKNLNGKREIDEFLSSEDALLDALLDSHPRLFI